MTKYIFTLCFGVLLSSCIPVVPIDEEHAPEVLEAPAQPEIHKVIEQKAVENTATEPVEPITPKSCEALGGTMHTEKKPQSTFGVCILPNGNECEEQALIRGTCPSGGIQSNAYATPAARYCAISGGIYTKTDSTGEEQGTCTRNGKTCDVWDLWNGLCL